MRLFAKKHADPRDSAADRLGAVQRQRMEQGNDAIHPPQRCVPSNSNLFRLVHARAASIAEQSSPPLHLHPALAQSLDFDGHLIGHEGCVNRLAWNSSATLLASGSDDCTVRLWDFTRAHRPQRLILQTGHSANIFAVGFLQSDHSIVSAGMDMDVRICNIDTQQCTDVFRCHPNRVKELCVDPSNDNLFLTSGEDGSCRQFDLRVPHHCTAPARARRRAIMLTGPATSSPCSNALVGNPGLPLKCVDISPAQPHFFLLSADDQFIRVYDRRMIRQGTCDSLYAPCYSRHAAGHLKRSHHSTFSQWDESGTQIVASYSGEQVYVYDFTGRDDDSYSSFSTTGETKDEDIQRDCDYEDSGYEPMAVDDAGETKTVDSPRSIALEKAFPSRFIPDAARPQAVGLSVAAVASSISAEMGRLKELGNNAFYTKDYSLSISYYNEALLLRGPRSPTVTSLLLSNRAAAYLKRNYPGDLAIALSDSMHAFRLDRSNLKALYRAVQCHKELRLWRRGVKLGLYALERVRGTEDSWDGERDLRSLVEEMQKERTKQKREEAKREEQRGGGQRQTARRQQKEERKRKEEERKQRRTKRSNLKEREHAASGSSGSAAAGAGAPSAAPEKEKERKRKMASMRTESEEEVRAMETEVTSEENEDKRRRVNRSAAAHRADEKKEGKEQQSRTGREKSKAGSKEEKEREGKEAKEREEKAAHADEQSGRGVWNGLQDMDDESFETLILDTVNLTRQQWVDKYGEESDDEEDEDDDHEDAADDDSADDHEDRDSDDDMDEDHHHDAADKPEDGDEEDAEDDSSEAAEEVEDILALPRLHRRQPDNEHETSSLSDTPSLPPSASSPPASASSSAAQSAHAASKPAPSSSMPAFPPTTRTRRSFVQRFVGHANRQTDIKESTFWGPYILSGSDDGHVFMWDRRTARLLCVLRASEQIINCVRGHPFLPLVVTSGIDNEIGVWTVRERAKDEALDGKEEEEEKDGLVRREEFVRVAEANQRMRDDDEGGGWITAPMLASWLAQAMAQQQGGAPISLDTLRRMMGGIFATEDDEEGDEDS